jgi:hypothetical protein|tara:strand:+ start:267 stop:692 length:426 start_codon:yes stop_codon:yes gene_type:complete
MKTPKEISKIYDRLPKQKVELNAIRVELGIADDIKKSIAVNKAALDEVKKLEAIAEAAKKTYLKAEADAIKVRTDTAKKADKYNKLEDKTGQLLSKAEAAAKGLGVKPQAIDGFTELEDITIELGMQTNNLNNFDFDLGGA